MDLNAGFAKAQPVKPMINVGACLDIPSGTYLRGKFGDMILNGGLGALTGVAGIGNSFKSTICHYMMLSAMSKITKSVAKTYDTEMNIQEWHLQHFANQFDAFGGELLFQSGRWAVTDKTTLDPETGKYFQGDVWFDKYKDYANLKMKSVKALSVTTPFLDREGEWFKMIQPTFTQVDSFSEFVTQDVVKMQEDNSLGDKGANMVSMRQGMQKNRFLMEVPFLANAAYDYMLLTAHIGSEFNMDPNQPAPKKLQFLRGVKIKGAPEKFTFMMNMCWYMYNTSVLKNDNTKAPEYPRNKDDDLKGDTDLMSVSAVVLRNKNGPTGMAVTLVVSQQDGVLPSLTEFHNIKESGRFGITGTLQNYALDLLPDVSLSRTTVRGKIDASEPLRRALNITSEMCQIFELWHNLDECLYMSPKELYEKLKAKGYDWNVLLQTRSYWMLDDYEEPIPRLTTMDLLNMTRDETDPDYYHPYWMNPDKTIKPSYFPDLAKA
jgi:hypothetical protein